MKNKTTFILLLVVLAFFAYKQFSSKRSEEKSVATTAAAVTKQAKETSVPEPPKEVDKYTQSQSIDELTKTSVVVAYVKRHGELPDYYITKREARAQGWNPAEENLCDVLPGYAIGGDIFSNREHRLPDKKSRIWYEADLNYDCHNRGSDRLLFSNDGLIYVSYNHYKTFQER